MGGRFRFRLFKQVYIEKRKEVGMSIAAEVSTHERKLTASRSSHDVMLNVKIKKA